MSDVETTDPVLWCEELFEFEYCEECGGDAQHHAPEPSPFGHWFARCCYPPGPNGEPHPTIAAFRAEAV